jgi:ABC-type transporter Mla subunit MlaD
MMTKKQFAKQLEAIKRRIEKDRDDLRELINQAEDILDTNDRAADAMQEAADNLSELL